MADREKVITGLEACSDIKPQACVEKCPYREEGCRNAIRLMKDALELLKEQDAIKPYIDYDGQEVWRCGKCGNSLMHPSYYESDEDAKNFIRYCSRCGRAVAWE